MSLQQRVQQIGRVLGQAGKRMEPCLREWAVAGFEAHFGARLPEAYRLFLLLVGNGGWGPPRGGLGRLGEARDEMDDEAKQIWEQLPWVREPFPFTERIDSMGWREACCGCIYLGEDAYGMNWQLVVTGEEAGNVWRNGEVVCPASPRRDFLGWYEDWLEKQEWYPPAERVPGPVPVKSAEDRGIPF